MIENTVFATTINILSSALSGRSCPAFDRSIWPDVKKELQEQEVLALVSETLLKSDILEPEDKKELKQKAVVNYGRFFRIMKQQEETVKLLEENHIPVAVLKGTACAQYYDKPSIRQSGDIDLLVLPEDYNKALHLFNEKGYVQLDATDARYQRHIGFSAPSGAEIELHRFFSSSSNKGQNSNLDQLLFNRLRDTVSSVQIQQFSVPVFPALENGIVILGHINQHMRRGVSLRKVADWMMYVKNELNDDFWEKQFKEKAEAVGMADFCKILTGMCQKYLGLSADITWCRDADEELADELMLYVLTKKDEKDTGEKTGNTQRSIYRLLKPASTFRYLTEGGMIHMQENGIKPVKAFAWAYQIGHLFRKGLKPANRKLAWHGIKDNARDKDLLKRLKVTRL